MKKSAVISGILVSILLGYVITLNACDNEIELCKVSFNTNAGSALEDVTVSKGRNMPEPPPPTKLGYSFDGWYEEAECINKWDVASDVVVSDMTLYAKWIASGGIAYMVEHYLQDVSGDGYSKYETETWNGTTGTTATANSKSYTGFTVNTAHASRVESGEVAADGTLILKLYYDRDVFTIHYIEIENSVVSDLTGVRYGATVAEPTAPTRTGYEFGGWFKESSLVNAWSFESDAVTHATDLYAKWTLVSYSITYILNNGTNDAENPATYTNETEMITLHDPTRMSYPFEGWFANSDFSGDRIIRIETGSTGDKILYAKWKVYQLRDIGPAGGYIFYDKGLYRDGWQYLEAAPYGWYEGATDSNGSYSGDEDPCFQWGAFGYAIDPPATEAAVGSGVRNTESIVNYHDNLSNIYPTKEDYYINATQYSPNNDGTVAAKVCTDFSLAGGDVTYDDWFLPSKDELYKMYQNLVNYGLGGFHVTSWAYWSSTDYTDTYESYSQALNSFFQGHSLRSNKFMVRPVRAF